MDPRVSLIRDFSRTFDRHLVKIEAEEHGLPFLEELLSEGAALDYGELTPLRLVHRYKLVDVTDRRMNELLQGHVDRRWNVCRYFDPESNDVLCFNIDDNRKTARETASQEVEYAVRALGRKLRDLGCTPLIVASGRGYHAWCRFAAPVPNERLYRFQLLLAARALASVAEGRFDHNLVKINLYPHTHLKSVVSLRVYGSIHVKTKAFSYVLGEQGLLDEAASWDCFRDFVKERAIPLSRMEAALREVEIV